MTGTRQLPLIFPSEPTHQPAAATIRLLVFNAQHASPARARRQAAWIASQGTADLVIITEVGPGPGGHALTDALTENGYASVLAPEPALPDYRTVLASRGAGLAAVPSGIEALAHRGPAAAVSLAGQTIALLGLYVPRAARRNGATRTNARSSRPSPRRCPASWPGSTAR